MTESTEPPTYRTRSGRLLTEADLERIAEEVATTDYDIDDAAIHYLPEPQEPAREAGAESLQGP